VSWHGETPPLVSEYAEEDGDYEADEEAVSETANESDEYMPTTATSMPKYFRRMARRRLRYAYRDLRAALDEDFADDVLPKEVVALLPPEFLVNQVPNEQADEFRKIGREKGLKGEGLDRFVLKSFKSGR
jgi:hypothetical protein